jgi:hypothetical protein
MVKLMNNNQLLSSNQVKQQIKARKFPASHDAIVQRLLNLIRFFFLSSENGTEIDVPFRGFLLDGNPSCGKTEMVKQVALQCAKNLKEEGLEIKFIVIDAKSIATTKWGDAERQLYGMFESQIEYGGKKNPSAFYTDENEKIIYLFDDIDCFFFDRGANISMEWNYSVSSVLFHILDNLNAQNRMIIATSNNTKIMDRALLSRFYKISVPDYTRDELVEISKGMIKKLKSPKVLPMILQHIETAENPTMRDVENFIVEAYVDEVSTAVIPKRQNVKQYAEVEVISHPNHPKTQVGIQPIINGKVQEDQISVFEVIPQDEGKEKWLYHLTEGTYTVRTCKSRAHIPAIETSTIRVSPSFRVETIN